MPRSTRITLGGIVYHVLNRANARMRIFDQDSDYRAFEKIMLETLEYVPMRICAYCLMPNHWHLVLWPRGDNDLPAYMQRLTLTHVRRWQEYRRVVGTGHVYQGRYKAFPVQNDIHFHQLVRYVERNPLRANLVEKAEEWQWGSLWRRAAGSEENRRILSEWPVATPSDWVQWVNESEPDDVVEGIRRSIHRNRPYGGEKWQRLMARRLGLESSLRPRGRPVKKGI